MRTSIKLQFLLFAGISILLALFLWALLFVDVNLYRPQIERYLSTAFGRDIVLEGPLSLERSLTPRFVVNGLKIANPDWASRPFLAVVDKFDIRASLLPLLRGDLEIISLEFHGVDILLEKAANGANNFTFGGSDDPTGIPAIEQLLLDNVAIAYAVPESPVKHLSVEQITASKIPGRSVTIEAQTRINTVPVRMSLRGEPEDTTRPKGPWNFTLLGEADDLSVRIESSIQKLTGWSQSEYQFTIEGRRTDTLETLSGMTLPDAGPYQLAANIRIKPDDYLAVNDLNGLLGKSDFQGNLHWNFGAPRPAVKIRIASQQLDVNEWRVDNNQTNWNQPLNIDEFGETDLDVEIRIQRLDGLAKPVKDIVLTLHADQEQLRLAVVKATVDHTHIRANMVLPWSERLTVLSPEAASLSALLQHAELNIHAQAEGAIYRYAANPMERPMDFTLFSVEATARPDAPLVIKADATLNSKPVTINLQGESLATLLQHPLGPWQTLALEMHSDDIEVEANGSVMRPFEAAGFDVRYTLSGADIDAFLPLQSGAWSLSGHYTDHPDRNVFDELEITLGGSDIGGRVEIYRDGRHSRLVADLNATRIHLDEILPQNNGETTDTADWDHQFNIGGLATVDLDVTARIQQFQGLAKPVRNIRLEAHTDGQTLTLAPFRATQDGTHLDARVQLPWGERLTALEKNGVSIQRLAQHADVVLKAQVPDGKLHYQTNMMGHPLELGVTRFDATARPGEELQISARALLNDQPIQANLKAEPLADLLQRPTGPWQELALEVRKGDIRFNATGSVERPLETSGFEFDYSLSGTEINTLLPLFNLILPLEGAYSLTGHFADLPDRLVFDKLKIASGNNDISGDISVYQGQLRPRVVANLSSEEIYLSTLLPVSKTEAAPGAKRLVIPDYNLPIERMREIDGELDFKAKRLRTTTGELGDISFKATLQNGVFRMDPFRVRGWAGARVESELSIDATQDPPEMSWQWIARQLNYGVLLEQAGIADTVEGTVDVTLRLSGNGRTRREFLGDADGQLVIVGQEGKFGSRRLDLWGSDLLTTMLSSSWRSEDVTDLNCVVARIEIEDGLARSDKLLIDTQRITIAATGTLDLESEALNLVFAPRPKRRSLISLTNPVHITGTLAAPETAVTVLPRNRIAAAGTGLLAGLVNPGYLIFTFSQTGSRQANRCVAAVEEAMKLKDTQDLTDDLPGKI